MIRTRLCVISAERSRETSNRTVIFYTMRKIKLNEFESCKENTNERKDDSEISLQTMLIKR